MKLTNCKRNGFYIYCGFTCIRVEAQLIKTGVIVCCAGGSFTKLTHQGNNVVGYFNRQRSLALRAIDMEAHLDWMAD